MDGTEEICVVAKTFLTDLQPLKLAPAACKDAAGDVALIEAVRAQVRVLSRLTILHVVDAFWHFEKQGQKAPIDQGWPHVSCWAEPSRLLLSPRSAFTRVMSISYGLVLFPPLI
jgi:hypothetical protein